VRHERFGQRPQLLAHRVRLGIAAADEDAEEHTSDVGVQDRGALTEREAAYRARRIRADPLEREQRRFVRGQLAAVAFDRFSRDRVQPSRPDVVSERPPCVGDIALICGCKRSE
jgi:hypothetical protein